MADWLTERFMLDVASGAALRALMAGAFGLLTGLLLAPAAIRLLRRHCGERIDSASETLNRLHQAKQSTPTMGGLLVIGPGLLAAGLLTDSTRPAVWLAVYLTIGLAALGFVDDWLKVRRGKRGLSPRWKLAGQVIVTLPALAIWGVYSRESADTGTPIQILESTFSATAFAAIGLLVIVGASNAVNLTDGLDGLAPGILILALAAMGLVTFVSGHPETSGWIKLAKTDGCGELAVMTAGVVGALVAFLWFNRHPARIFLGDTGALSLGGLLGWLAVASHQEVLLLIVGGVFLVELFSVIAQVACFRLMGMRLFRCAPLHHHFQFMGWPEKRIVVRFWIAAAICVALGAAWLGVTRHDRSTHLAVRPHHHRQR